MNGNGGKPWGLPTRGVGHTQETKVEQKDFVIGGRDGRGKLEQRGNQIEESFSVR